jgi:hypothetical protein
MEFAQIETSLIEEISLRVDEVQSSEISDLQLALVGGGNAVVLFI